MSDIQLFLLSLHSFYVQTREKTYFQYFMKSFHLSFAYAQKLILTALLLVLAMGEKANAQTLQEKIANQQQLTNLPTVYLIVPDAEGQDINSVLSKTGNVAEYHAATIQVVDNSGALEEFTDSKLEIKVRGNSTAQDSKRPYRLKFGKDKKDAEGNVIETHKHDMLGLGYAKRNWTLLTNHKDKSLLHNALTYYVGQAVGMDFCPGYQFVDLVINGEYRGNYMLSDHCEVGSHRIDVDENTGWFLEAARGDMVEEPLVEAAGLRISIKNPEPADEAETAALKASVSEYFNRLNHFWGIYSTPCSDAEFQNPRTGWRAYIDEESLVKFYIGINLTDDYDGFMTVKLYREADGKLMFGPLWDKDLAYGNWQNHGKLCEEYQPGYTFCDHITRMMTDPYLVRNIHDKLHEIVDAGFVTNMQARISEMGAMLTESQRLNQQMWWTCDDYPAAIQELKDYVSEHTAYVVSEIDKKYVAMGCATLPEWTDNEGGGDNNQEDEPSSAGPYETTLGEWSNVPLPQSAIHPRATAFHLSVVGTSFFRLLNSNEEKDYIEQYSFSYDGANQTGREFDITDVETLNKAKAGTLFLRCGGGQATVTITCTVPETPDTSGDNGDNDPEQPVTHQQLTNLPTIYLSAEVIDGDWQPASIEVFDRDNKLMQGVEWRKESTQETLALSIQYQGSGTIGSKNSYRLKFEKKLALLSSVKYKQWVLASNDDDPSLMRNALAKGIGDALGLPFTPGYQFVDLYVNDEYMGTYQLTDRIKAEEGRALVSGGNKDNDWHIRFNDSKEIKEDGLQASEYIPGTTAAPYIIPKNPDSKDITAKAFELLKADMESYFMNTVFTKDADGHYSNIADQVDKQQLVAWYIAQEILGIYKGFSSIEAYRSVSATANDQLLHLGLLWDNEKSLGNPGEAPEIDMSDLEPTDSYKGLMTNYATYDVMKNLFNDLWSQPWFAHAVNDLWNEKQAALLTDLKQKAADLKVILSESQTQNNLKWENSLGEHATYDAAVSQISTYLDQRFSYLSSKFEARSVLALPTITDMVKAILKLSEENDTYCDLNNDKQVTVEDLILLINKRAL